MVFQLQNEHKIKTTDKEETLIANNHMKSKTLISNKKMEIRLP